MRVVVAADKFRGTATAPEVTAAVADAAHRCGWTCTEIPLADGGEGTLDAFGGANRHATVTGPLGDPVVAPWRLDRGQRAIIEMAAASGLALVGGADRNDAIAASTYGTGELIGEAIEAGAKRILVGVGGSATTDGGLGALRALYPLQRLRSIEMIVACDVTTRFVDAAAVFGPQKGATEAQVEFLRRRLERLVQVYRDEHGLDLTDRPRAGAAGGLAGALAAAGARLTGGFEVIAEEVELYDRLEGADLVITGEGKLDATSLSGKVVGGVEEMARDLGIEVVALVGTSDLTSAESPLPFLSLAEHYGMEAATGATLDCVRRAAVRVLTDRGFGGPDRGSA